MSKPTFTAVQLYFPVQAEAKQRRVGPVGGFEEGSRVLWFGFHQVLINSFSAHFALHRRYNSGLQLCGHLSGSQKR
jgi:hypothetical protein